MPARIELPSEARDAARERMEMEQESELATDEGFQKKGRLEEGAVRMMLSDVIEGGRLRVLSRLWGLRYVRR